MADKIKHYNGITPKGVAKFPRLNKPDTKFNAAGVYSVKLVLSEEDATPLMEAINTEAQKAFDAEVERLNKAGKKALATKLKLADPSYEPEVDADGEETGNVVFNFKTNASFVNKQGETIHKEVTMFDAKGVKLEGKKRAEIWGGSELKVAFALMPYANAATKTVGVSQRLNAVQVLKLVSGGGASAESYGFGKEEGFEASEVEDDSPFSDSKDSEQDGAGSSQEDDDF
jgi:hypothetical protein